MLTQLLISFTMTVYSTFYAFYIIGLKMTKLDRNMAHNKVH